MLMRLSAEINERLADVKAARERARERFRSVGAVLLVSLMAMGGVAPFVRDGGATPAYARTYPPQGKPRTIVETQIKKVPRYIHHVKVATADEHGWPTTGEMCSWSGVTLDCGAMSSFRHISSIVGYPIPTVSDFRTREQQAALYYSKPGVAAPPGTSLHEEGKAIDLAASAQIPLIEKLLYAHGWRQFSPSGEPWHWSYLTVG